MAQGETTITGIIAQSGRIDRALADASGLTRERIKALIAQGRIQLGGQTLSQTTVKAIPGTRFTIHLPAPTPIHAQPQDIALNIAYEDDHLIVVDKPAGLVVHPAAGNLDGTLVNALLHHCSGTLSGIGGAERPGIVHRIDKDTSGLLVVAKSDAAHQGLARQFADHSLERAYMAIVGGRPMPAAGTLRDAIVRSDANRKKMTLI
ncbi:MAG: Ribosomal large subunit pseudouridine synthase, partial [Pseudomonadota bacterium]